MSDEVHPRVRAAVVEVLTVQLCHLIAALLRAGVGEHRIRRIVAEAIKEAGDGLDAQ